MSDSARFDLSLSARTILVGCSLAQSRGGSAAREPSFHSGSGLKAELGHAACVVLHQS